MSILPLVVQQITPTDITLMRAMLETFGEVFDDADTYQSKPPTRQYLEQLLDSDHFIALVALVNDDTAGALAAYELQKFEQARSEIYIYDLAVKSQYRRQGVATRLIEVLQEIAAARGAHVIFVQADTGVEDEPAIRLYSKLGQREEVLHFDIAVHRET